jgi:CHAT domain-containing protein
MGPLIEHVRRWQLHRPARLVLVPMGILGLVPWHAASTVRRTGRRYAVEDIVVSYSPSARMMCQAARRPDRPIRSALVVGNPSGDLPGAGAEARAVHRRFYPDGAYLGQPAGDGEGTPEEVLAWIENAAPGPSLLHFACHARVDADKPADAHLVLAHGRRLAARDLLDASRLAALDVDMIYLAACTTHVGGKDYDEVLSLATAFLAAGARTVFGSLWRVPDEATSLLMYLVHHHITIDGCAPAEALHRAQLWMLDSERQPPDGMPQELARLCSRPDAADPVSWAAFTHLGR